MGGVRGMEEGRGGGRERNVTMIPPPPARLLHHSGWSYTALLGGKESKGGRGQCCMAPLCLPLPPTH